MAKVRDRRPGWFWADNSLIQDFGSQLKPYGIAVYCALAKIAGEESVTTTSIATIARLVGCSAGKARESLQLLETLGWIEIRYRTIKTDLGKTRNLTSEYILLPAPPTPSEAGYSTTDRRVLPDVQEGTPPGGVIKEPILKEPNRKEAIEKKKAVKPPKPTSTIPADHPLILVWREELRVSPTSAAPPSEWLQYGKDWREVIVAIVQEDVEGLRDTLKAWKGITRNQHNISGILGLYQERRGKKNDGPTSFDDVESSPRQPESVPESLYRGDPKFLAVWRKTYEELKLRMDALTFDSWLARAELIGYRDETYIVQVASVEAQAWLDGRLKETVITSTLCQIAGRPVGIEFVVAEPSGIEGA